MRFSADELAKFARWESVIDGYQRDTAFEDNGSIRCQILPLIQELTASGRFGVRVVEGGGLSNYFAFFVHDIRSVPDKSKLKAYTTARWPGVAVYLSLLAPYGVFGRTHFDIDTQCQSLAILGPDEVCDPHNSAGPIDIAVIEMIGRTSYRFLSRDDVSQPLPADVKPYEYCHCSEPWDKVFHVLFSNTD